jgi:hypothetical protein
MPCFSHGDKGYPAAHKATSNIASRTEVSLAPSTPARMCNSATKCFLYAFAEPSHLPIVAHRRSHSVTGIWDTACNRLYPERSTPSFAAIWRIGRASTSAGLVVPWYYSTSCQYEPSKKTIKTRGGELVDSPGRLLNRNQALSALMATSLSYRDFCWRHARYSQRITGTQMDRGG